MELKWRSSTIDGHQLYLVERGIRVAELSVRGSDWRWYVVLSYSVAPWDFVPDRSSFDTLEEAKEYTENLVRILIIGGHHERNRIKRA
jgi:hypothetical protein